MTENQVQTESIVKKVLTSEAKYIIGIIIFLAGVVAPYYDIRTEIALIKQSNVAMQEDIKELTEEIKIIKTTKAEMIKTISTQNTQISTLKKR